MKRSNWVGIGLSMLLASNGNGLAAAEKTVHEFDGWKIVIQPGDFSPPTAISNAVPPAPAPVQSSRNEPATSELQLVSLQSEPKPETAVLDAAPTPKPDEDGLPVITPGDFGAVDQHRGVDPAGGQGNPLALAQLYSEVYRSIPYSRTEHRANPSYRHEATMEILLGQLRPTVIHKGSVQVFSQSPLGYCHPPVQVMIPGVGLRIHRSN